MKLITRIAVVGVLAAALSAGACNRANDPTKTTETALKESNLGAVKVDWDKEAHVAHLKGAVDTQLVADCSRLRPSDLRAQRPLAQKKKRSPAASDSEVVGV